MAVRNAVDNQISLLDDRHARRVFMEVSPYSDLECGRSCLEISGALYQHNDWRSGHHKRDYREIRSPGRHFGPTTPRFWHKQPKTTIFRRTARYTICSYCDIQAAGNSAYLPPTTVQQIDIVKSQIRQRRERQAPDASAGSQSIADTPPTTLLPGSSPHNWNPTITAFVTVITMLAVIPGYKAWQTSAHAPGTVQDADFWILIQGSIMQLLGLVTIIFAQLISSTSLPARSQPWFWTWGFVMTSLICLVSAVPLYVFYPTEWSQTVSFLGSAAQVFVILQAMFTKEKSSSNADKNK